jgi:hypothetical protein
VAKSSVWEHIREDGVVPEAMRVALDDTSPAVITAAAESMSSLLGSRQDLRDRFYELQLQGETLPKVEYKL